MATDPDWNAPAQLDGLPYTNWKRRAGYTETGTLAAMVQRWLTLPWNIQQGCSLRWEATDKAEGGHAQANGIGALVLRVGLPPAMLTGRSREPTREEIERMFAKPVRRAATSAILTDILLRSDRAPTGPMADAGPFSNVAA